jgi:hypothetical protein
LNLQGLFFFVHLAGIFHAEYSFPKPRKEVRLATPLAFTGNTVMVTIHFGTGTMLYEVKSFFATPHVGAMRAAVTLKLCSRRRVGLGQRNDGILCLNTGLLYFVVAVGTYRNECTDQQHRPP